MNDPQRRQPKPTKSSYNIPGYLMPGLIVHFYTYHQLIEVEIAIAMAELRSEQKGSIAAKLRLRTKIRLERIQQSICDTIAVLERIRDE